MTTVNVTTSISMTKHMTVNFNWPYNVKKSNVYIPRHFRPSYKVIFGHLYSVKLTILKQNGFFYLQQQSALISENNGFCCHNSPPEFSNDESDGGQDKQVEENGTKSEDDKVYFT